MKITTGKSEDVQKNDNNSFLEKLQAVDNTYWDEDRVMK
jgi:hypothetical protein